MLLKDGSIRVADFGIARITASSKTATGTVMGTPSYMSPEQVAGKKVDGRSDLFSLSVALFELVAGEKPFKGGEGLGTLLFQIANDPHPDITTVKAGLPPALKAVLDKGLAKNPDLRFQRGSEMAAALRAVLAGLKGGAPAPAPAAAPAPEITQPTPKSDKTVSIGPEITIPGLNDAPTLTIEQPRHAGVGPAVNVPPPQNPDATVRMEPHAREPI
jgi:serine/threonine-protein kinase